MTGKNQTVSTKNNIRMAVAVLHNGKISPENLPTNGFCRYEKWTARSRLPAAGEKFRLPAVVLFAAVVE